MCKRKKKSNIAAPPSGLEEKQMKDKIISDIDNVLLNWSMPDFGPLVKDDLIDCERKIRVNLGKAREILANMFLPRNDARIYVFVDKITKAIDLFHVRERGISIISPTMLVNASEQVLLNSKNWETVR